MPCEPSGALIGVCGTILGVGIGALLSRQAAQDLLTQQAKTEFASSFADTLLKLHAEVDNIGEGSAMHILENDFGMHSATYLKLRLLIPKKNQASVERAWQHYTNKDQRDLSEEGARYCFSHVLADTDEHTNLLAIRHIERFLDEIRS